jgi:hypothetical protein
MRIFPFLELSAEYTGAKADAANANMKGSPAKAFLAEKVFKVWKCTSSSLPDFYSPGGNDADDAQDNYGARNNDGGAFSFANVGANGHQIPAYVGVSGAYNDPAGRDTVRTYQTNYYGTMADTGVFLLNESVPLAALPDGTSNTLAVAEQSGKNGDYDMRNRHTSPWGGPEAASVTSSMTGGTYKPSDVASLSQVIATFGAASKKGIFANGIVTVRSLPNTALLVTGGDFPYSANTPLNSFHPGGINAMMTDGSVRFVTDGVEFAALARMCSRDDGMPTAE